MQNTLSPRARLRVRAVAALTALALAATGVAAGATAAAAAAPTVAAAPSVAAARVVASPQSTKPSIKGTAKVGVRLTAVTGEWAKGTKFAYAWKVGGTKVGSAKTFTPKASHRGKKVQLVVTGSRPGHSKVARASVKKTIVAGTFGTATPKITGSAKVGSTLKVTRGTWKPAPSSFSYRWYANGSAISGATGTSFKITSAQKGKKITVRVTGQRSGYTTKTRTSAATATVAYVAPRITGQPVGDYVQAGTTVRMSVTATGSSLQYQWQRLGQGEDTWRNLAGKTASSLSFTARSVDTLAEYRVVVKNAVGTVTSTPVMLLVDSSEAEPYPAETMYLGNYWLQLVMPTESYDLGGGQTEVYARVLACSTGGDTSETPWWDLFSEYRAGGVWYDAEEYDLGVDENGCGIVMIDAVVPTSGARGGIWSIEDYSGSTEFGITKQYIDGLN